jgi:hypothetical protein
MEATVRIYKKSFMSDKKRTGKLILFLLYLSAATTISFPSGAHR